jgi:hypothetical protein
VQMAAYRVDKLSLTMQQVPGNQQPLSNNLLCSR